MQYVGEICNNAGDESCIQEIDMPMQETGKSGAHVVGSHINIVMP